MSDAKSAYSETSNGFVNKDAGNSEAAKKIYEASKKREVKYNDEWEKNPVNINEVVDEFAPNSVGEKVKGKFIYRGGRYNVVADMAAGYLRIYDTELKGYVRLDGTLGTNSDQTHFKIKKREEM